MHIMLTGCKLLHAAETTNHIYVTKPAEPIESDI